MAVPPPTTCSFVLRVGGDGTGDEPQPWWGVITHVPSGRHEPVRSLHEALGFIDRHMQALGLARAEADGPLLRLVIQNDPRHS